MCSVEGKADSAHDHTGSGGVSEAIVANDGSRNRDLLAKPESQSQNDHTNSLLGVHVHMHGIA